MPVNSVKLLPTALTLYCANTLSVAPGKIVRCLTGWFKTLTQTGASADKLLTESISRRSRDSQPKRTKLNRVTLRIALSLTKQHKTMLGLARTRHKSFYGSNFQIFKKQGLLPYNLSYHILYELSRCLTVLIFFIYCIINQ